MRQAAGGAGPARLTGVTGGSHGLTATYDGLLQLAALLDRSGDRLRDRAGLGFLVLADGDLVESALLSPVSFARAEAAVLAATTGPDGVLVASLAAETDAVLVRAAVVALRETDALVHAGFEVLDHLTGRAVGFALGASAPALAGAALVAWVLLHRLPPAQREQVLAAGGRALQDWVVAHPDAVEHLVNGGGGLLDGLWDGLTPGAPGGPTLTPDTESAAALLSALYGDDGWAVVRPLDVQVPGDAGPPASLAGLVGHLGQVAGLSPDPSSPLNGTLEVQSFTGADGRAHHVVYLPGTDDLTTLPWTQDGDVRDMATNLLLVGGQDNAYLDGIREAMHRAGIAPGDPVLLAGHSQGGMEAAALAADPGDFRITHVVTAGSPTSQVDGFAPGTRILSLEHRGDVVPLLDGEPNPDTVGQVTVEFTDPAAPAGVVGHHDLTTYTRGAASVDASRDPSVRDLLASLREQGLLGAHGPARSQVFQVTRGGG